MVNAHVCTCARGIQIWKYTARATGSRNNSLRLSSDTRAEPCFTSLAAVVDRTRDV